MKQIILKSLLALGVAFSLLLLILGRLTAAAQPQTLDQVQFKPHVEAARPAGLPPAQQESITPTVPAERPHLQIKEGGPYPLPDWVQKLMQGKGVGPAASSVQIVKAASTKLDPAVGSLVEDGEFITYTIRVTNKGTSATSVEVFDILPTDPQGNVQLRKDITFVGGCGAPNTCETLVETKTITFATSGGGEGQIPITKTTRITWTVASLAPGASQTLTFRGAVFCQPNGAVLKNRAFFLAQGTGGSSNQTQTTVQTKVDQSGQAFMLAGPTGCSTTVETANRVAAGDFDADGDLDIALASYAGTTVFQNNGKGQFQQIFNDTISSEDVVWADFDNDGKAELLSVGIWDNTPGGSPLPNGGNYPFYTGFNYLYRYNGTDFNLVRTGNFTFTFKSNDGLIRAAAADYTGDGNLDLATANYWGGCTLLLYKNRGTAVPFEENLNFGAGPGNLSCLLQYEPVGSLAWGDYENDGDPDLAVGSYVGPNFPIQVYLNTGNNVVTTTPVSVLASNNSPAVDMAWGDYRNDGFLDLAVAFSDGSVKVFRNLNGGGFSAAIPILNPSSFGAAVDWADFNGDGQLDLVAAQSNTRPRIFTASGDTSFTQLPLGPGVVRGNVFGARGLDTDNDGDIDLAVANQNGVSAIFSTFAPSLKTSLTPLPSLAGAEELAWGDFDHNGTLDLLLGTTGGGFGSLVHKNNAGVFAAPVTLISGPGPQAISVGDIDKDGDLDAAISTSDEYQLHRNNVGNLVLDQIIPAGGQAKSLALADADDDGDLDLLAGKSGSISLFSYNGAQFNTTPAWSVAAGDVRAVAWLDFNGDFFPDFAAGIHGGKTRLYRNNGNNTFSLDSTLPISQNTTSLAWGDWDGDGQAELAVGNENQPNRIYKRQGNAWVEVWNSGIALATSSLAWGDWNNDGDLDLAVGNKGQADQVYENLLVQTGTPQLAWRWTSDQATRQTTGVAWGDLDRDGDLDLAVSQSGGGSNGVYLNTYISPSHLVSNFSPTMPLPNNPSYASMARPGTTADAYFFSASEILASPTISTVDITFNVFDPDRTRDIASTNLFGDDIISLQQTPQNFQYSTDGGGTWRTVTSGTLLANPGGFEDTLRLGQPYTFRWNTQVDKVVSDDVRFRITLINHMGRTDNDSPSRRAGLSQRGSVSAISPPFRVRALTCFWPANPLISIVTTAPYSRNVPLDFVGTIQQGSDEITFTWDFGDKVSGIGQAIEHTYTANGTYTAVMTVTGQACPVARSVVTTRTIKIGTGVPDKLTYLPLLQKSTATATSAEVPGLIPFELTSNPGAPGQVAGLSGSSQPGGATQLAWQANPAADQVLGYRVYRSVQGMISFQRLAELPAMATGYTDTSTGCNANYFVTAYNESGESLPSTTSYFTRPCP